MPSRGPAMCRPPRFVGRERASSPDGLLPKAHELAEFGDSHRSPSEDRRKQRRSVAVPELPLEAHFRRDPYWATAP